MSFRGRGFGGVGRGGRRGNRNGGNRNSGYDQGPPEQITEIGYFTHACEDDIVCHNTSGKIPYFNAAIFFENKEQIGKVDEIFGGIKNNGFTVKLQDGIKASSFKEAQKLFIDSGRLLPIERFLPSGADKRGRATRGSGRGGRGWCGNDRGRFRGRGNAFNRGGSGDRGAFRSGSRGSFRGGGEWTNRSGGYRGSDFGGGFRGKGGSDIGNKRIFNGRPEATQNKRTKFDD